MRGTLRRLPDVALLMTIRLGPSETGPNRRLVSRPSRRCSGSAAFTSPRPTTRSPAERNRSRRSRPDSHERCFFGKPRCEAAHRSLPWSGGNRFRFPSGSSAVRPYQLPASGERPKSGRRTDSESAVADGQLAIHFEAERLRRLRWGKLPKPPETVKVPYAKCNTDNFDAGEAVAWLVTRPEWTRLLVPRATRSKPSAREKVRSRRTPPESWRAPSSSR